MVMLAVPAPGAGMVEGAKLTVTPCGSPVAASEILEEKPPITVVVMLILPELPCRTAVKAGTAVTVKSGGTTDSVTFTERTSPPPVPKITRG